MDNRGQVMGRFDHWIAGVVVAIAIVAIVVNEIMRVTGWGSAKTAAAAGVGLVLLAVSWLVYRGGRRLGDWAAEQWGGSHE